MAKKNNKYALYKYIFATRSAKKQQTRARIIKDSGKYHKLNT